MKIKSFKTIAIVLLITGTFLAGDAFGRTLIYTLSKDSTKENPQKFFCNATKIEPTYPGDTVFMSNFVQMIKGFQTDGNKIIKADELNKVYFLAYHDTNLPQYKNEPGEVTLTAGTFEFACFNGDGGRQLVEGPYGLARQSR